MAEIRILVIEDNEIGMMLVHELLKMRGYTVYKAGDAETGLQIAKREPPDLIIMDVGLPKMDGLTATRILRGDPETARIPILVLTAHAMSGDKERALEAGCTSYLSKPINVEQFFETVSGLLGASGE